MTGVILSYSFLSMRKLRPSEPLVVSVRVAELFDQIFKSSFVLCKAPLNDAFNFIFGRVIDEFG